MEVKLTKTFTNIFHRKALQNLSKLEFCNLKISRLATLQPHRRHTCKSSAAKQVNLFGVARIVATHPPQE
jgi:hypothetical protein